MIKSVKNSLTIKICILTALLLMAAGGITYGAVMMFLPTYYSSRLRRELDGISKEMAETLSSYETIEETFYLIELFEVGSQVDITVLDAQGEPVWPRAIEETAYCIENVVVTDSGRTLGVTQWEDIASRDSAAESCETFGEAEVSDGIAQAAEVPPGDALAAEGMAKSMISQDAAEKEQSAEKEPEGQAAAEERGAAEKDKEERAAEEEAEERSAEKEPEGQEAAEERGAAAEEPEEPAAAEVWDSVVEEAVDVWAGTGDGGQAREVRVGAVLGGETLSAVNQYPFTVGGENYTMVVSGGMQQVNQAMEILYRILPYILGLSFAVAVLLALAASLYLTGPVVRLSRIAKSMAALDFSSVYRGKRTDEIGLLGNSLNELSENLSTAMGELQQANEKLQADIRRERAIEKKRIAFFSAVSHELKTPITILKGHLTGMLQEIGEYRNRDYYLRRSLGTAEKMEDMVKELLTVCRIENNAFSVKRADVSELLRQQAAEMTELLAEIPEHQYAQVHPAMMEKVFRNLLMNAIRYTPAGCGNQIRVRMERQEAFGRSFSFSIENTGVFLPEDSFAYLYDAFYRVEQSRNRETGGSGLGLYIVKMILEQHGAEYQIENTAEGVKFSLLL